MSPKNYHCWLLARFIERSETCTRTERRIGYVTDTWNDIVNKF